VRPLTGGRKSAYRVLVGKFEGKGQLGRPRLRWEENNKVGCSRSGMKAWTGLIWLRRGTGGGFF
jgi:hypothetical protein